MYAFGRSFLKGALTVGAGVFIAATGGTAALVIGPALIGSGVYSAGKATVRGAREIADEEDGECYYVYYDLRNSENEISFAAAANFIIPEWGDTDLIASGVNKKLAHCVAWFTTSRTSYVKFEITSNKSEGVIAKKYLPGSKSSVTSTI